MPAQETISEHTRPAPWRRPWRRKAWTLTPAIGARTTRVGTSTSRIHQDSRKFACTARAWYPGGIDERTPSEYHPPPPGAQPPAVFLRVSRRTRLERSHFDLRGLQEAQGGDRASLDGAPPRDRRANPRRPRVRRQRRERGVRHGEARPRPSRGPHRADRGTAQER